MLVKQGEDNLNDGLEVVKCRHEAEMVVSHKIGEVKDGKRTVLQHTMK